MCVCWLIGFKNIEKNKILCEFACLLDAASLTLHDGNAHQMARAPVALHKTPSARNINSIPRIPEPVALELDARLIASRLAKTFNHNTIEASVTVECMCESHKPPPQATTMPITISITIKCGFCFVFNQQPPAFRELVVLCCCWSRHKA